jgi:hypothetical protein
MQETKQINLQQFTVDWASITIKRFAQSLVKKQVGGTALKSSFKFQIVSGADGPQKVIFSYLNTGKFVDMGVGRGVKLGDVKGNKALYKATGVQGRAAKKWYSKTMSAETKRLAELMSIEYGQSMIAVATEDIPNEINLFL